MKFTIASALIALAICTQAPAQPTAIDTHVHVGLATPNAKSGEADGAYFSATPAETGRALVKQLDASGVRIALLMGQIGMVSESDPLGIGRSLEIGEFLGDRVRYIGAACLERGDNLKHMAEVDAALHKLRGRVVAFKCYTGYHGHPMDLRYFGYYELAQKHDLPVIFHTGDTWSLPGKGDITHSHPRQFDKVATSFSKLKIVLAHVGVPWHLDAVMIAWKNNNVWLDLSGLYVGDSESMKALLQAERVPPAVPGLIIDDLTKALAFLDRWDQIIYASDWPLFQDLALYRRFIEQLVPADQHDKVFRENAETLFGLRPAKQ